MSRPSRDTPEGRTYLALRALSRRTGRATSEVFQLYTLERFVARLATSNLRNRLVLKGGVLMAAFGQRRPTRDVDLLALDVDNDPATIQGLVAEIAAIDLEDGVSIDPDSIRASTIREGAHYAGVRVHLGARLATARVHFHVDVNVGDPVEPPARPTDLPSLLDELPLNVLAYPIEMVVAEKLITAFERGGTNTRWRDFADLLVLMDHDMPVEQVSAALRCVATHRGVPLGELAVIRAEMGSQAQPKWAAWRRKQGLGDGVPERLDDALEALEPWVRGLLAAVEMSGDGQGQHS